jgi:hypothetical protein
VLNLWVIESRSSPRKGRRKTGLRFLRLHSLLWAGPASPLSSGAPDGKEANASNANRDPGSASPATARTCAHRRRLAASCGGRLLPLPCCAHESAPIGWFPNRSLSRLAARTEAAQPANPDELGSFQSNSAPVHTAMPQAPPIPGRALLRVTYLRQEPYAVVPLVRICARGGPQGASLARPHKWKLAPRSLLSNSLSCLHQSRQ